jgi:hypothetical protein
MNFVSWKSSIYIIFFHFQIKRERGLPLFDLDLHVQHIIGLDEKKAKANMMQVILLFCFRSFPLLVDHLGKSVRMQ